MTVIFKKQLRILYIYRYVCVKRHAIFAYSGYEIDN